MAYHFKNLVFEGGGVKGIAYVGAMRALDERGILKDIVRAGGTSAGAINALLFGLNYSPEETREVLWGLNFNNFLDDSWGVIKDAHRVIQEFGWYKGDFFREWVSKLIEKKTNNPESTFGEVSALKDTKGFRDMYFVGTNLSTHFCEVFSYEHTPRMCIADAVRISMSIPLFFAARRSMRGDVYVDGGLLLNYPIALFDREKYTFDQVLNRPHYDKHNDDLEKAGIHIDKYIYNKETLGFRLDSDKEIGMFRDQAEPAHDRIDDFFDYVRGLVGTVLESQQNRHLHSDNWHRTIYIDSKGVKTTQFDLADAKKEELIASGYAGVTKYFDDWYDISDEPMNK